MSSGRRSPDRRLIPDDFDYAAVRALSFEARQVLAAHRPANLAAAARLPGVTPAADVAVAGPRQEASAHARRPTTRACPCPPTLDRPGAGTAVSDAELTALLSDGAAELGLPLTLAQVDRLVAYLRLIERWNGAYNLTAVREPRAMVVQHLLDCLAVVAPLRRELGATDSARLLDVGSGAGLPGVVIAAIEPALRRRLRRQRRQEGRVRDPRGGGVGADESAPPSTGASRSCRPASRSTSSPAAPSRRSRIFSRRRGALLGTGGIWMAMKGKTPSEELGRLGRGRVSRGTNRRARTERRALPRLDSAKI